MRQVSHALKDYCDEIRKRKMRRRGWTQDERAAYEHGVEAACLAGEVLEEKFIHALAQAGMVATQAAQSGDFEAVVVDMSMATLRDSLQRNIERAASGVQAIAKAIGADTASDRVQAALMLVAEATAVATMCRRTRGTLKIAQCDKCGLAKLWDRGASRETKGDER